MAGTSLEIILPERAAILAVDPTVPSEFAFAGVVLIVLAAVVLAVSACVLAFKVRAPGRWLTLFGITVIACFFAFQQTVAADAELRYGPSAVALALFAYGIGGLTASLGYARLAWSLLGSRNAR